MAAKQISKQMELFEDGGLKDEGGMIDEVSGNDVPTGSTREEVRDDIPAQLSEGEFVLPADVVRYHGLEKIMELRDEAKQGLQKMEAMGQMGNSEEATLPDDIPFDIDDLDMEDEDEPQEMEMAEGGYVMVAGKPMPIPRIGGQLPPITTRPMPETKNMAVGGFTNPTGTYQVPTNIATQPSYFQQYSQSTAPFQPFVPPAGQQQTQVQQPIAGLTQQQQTYPSFATLMPTVGGKRETIEYRNAAGQKLFIPFVDGKPIYPIPEGYTKYVAEEQPIAEDKPVTSTTTQVTTGDGSDNVLYPYSSLSKEVTNGDKITLRTIASTAASTTTTGTLTVTGVSSSFSVTTRPPIYKTIPDQFTFTDLEGLDTSTLVESNDVTLTGITTGYFGTASISNGEYRVTRSGTIVVGYTTDSSLVTVGDVIRLRKTTASSVEQALSVTYQVSGIDTTVDVDGIPGSTSDTWSVKTKDRDCIADSKSLSSVTGVERDSLQSVSFTATGFDTGCNMKVSTSNSNSYLSVGGVTGSSNISVTPGQTVTVYMTASGSFSDTRTTTITLKSDDRVESTTFNWSVSTRAIDCVPTGTVRTEGPGAQCPVLVTDVGLASYSYPSVAPLDTPAGVSEHVFSFRVSNFDAECGTLFVGGTGSSTTFSRTQLTASNPSLTVTIGTPSGFRNTNSFTMTLSTSGGTIVFGPVTFSVRTCSAAQYTARVNAGCYPPL